MGDTSPEIMYSKSSFTHTAGSRWTKKFWPSSCSFSRISIDHNLAYLAKTKFIPNYDPSKHMSESTIAGKYTSWLTKDKDIYDAGWWTKAINSPGGRPDFGIYPGWAVWWLYSGDYRMEEIALTQGELAGAWTVHHREGDSSKYLDRNSTQSGIGRIVSLSGRPTIWSNKLTSNETSTDDKIVPVGLTTTNGWSIPDNEHFIDPASPQYHWNLLLRNNIMGLGKNKWI